MSQAAVMIAARDAIQDLFKVDASICEIGFDGTPKPSAGEWYYAVHAGVMSSVSSDWDLGEEYQVQVTVTRRMGVTPTDRWGIGAWLADPNGGAGLEARCRQIITRIHHNQIVRIAADDEIDGGASGKILTPLQWLSTQPPVLRLHTWFSAPAPKTEYEVSPSGVSVTIVFGRCQRVQSIPDMD
jgi:hypothetical protein